MVVMIQMFLQLRHILKFDRAAEQKLNSKTLQKPYLNNVSVLEDILSLRYWTLFFFKNQTYSEIRPLDRAENAIGQLCRNLV